MSFTIVYIYKQCLKIIRITHCSLFKHQDRIFVWLVRRKSIGLAIFYQSIDKFAHTQTEIGSMCIITDCRNPFLLLAGRQYIIPKKKQLYHNTLNGFVFTFSNWNWASLLWIKPIWVYSFVIRTWKENLLSCNIFFLPCIFHTPNIFATLFEFCLSALNTTPSHFISKSKIYSDGLQPIYLHSIPQKVKNAFCNRWHINTNLY